MCIRRQHRNKQIILKETLEGKSPIPSPKTPNISFSETIERVMDVNYMVCFWPEAEEVCSVYLK